MNEQAGKGKSLISIHLLRFIAAFSVYYYHQHFGQVIDRYTGTTFMTATELAGGVYAVPLFFLISGFCIHHSYVEKLALKEPFALKPYVLRRLWRIYPPYLVVLFFSAAIIPFTQPDIHIGAADLFAHFFLVHNYFKKFITSINLSLWTIGVEMALYLAYPFFYYLARKFSIDKALLVSLAVSLCSISWFQTTDTEVTLPERYFFTNLWFGWCLGAWLCDKVRFSPELFDSTGWKAISLLIFITVILLQLMVWQIDIVRYVVNIILWAPILIWLVKREAFLQSRKRWFKLPVAIGVSGYSLYLLHVPLIELKNYLVHLVPGREWQVPLMVLGIPLIPLITYFSYLVFERPFFMIRQTAGKYGK